MSYAANSVPEIYDINNLITEFTDLNVSTTHTQIRKNEQSLLSYR